MRTTLPPALARGGSGALRCNRALGAVVAVPCSVWWRIPLDDGVCASGLQFNASNDPRVSCRCMPRYVAGAALPLDVETPVHVPSRAQPEIRHATGVRDGPTPRGVNRVPCHESGSVPELSQGDVGFVLQPVRRKLRRGRRRLIG